MPRATKPFRQWLKNGPNRLMIIGWQAIADELGCHPLTAKFWAAEKELPVVKLPNGQVALPWYALREWLSAKPCRLTWPMKTRPRRAQ